MRVKQKIDARTRSSILRVELDKGAELDYEDSCIIMGGIPPFAIMEITPRGKAPVLTYQMNFYDVPLDEFLERSLDSFTLANIFSSFANLVECCELHSLSLQRVMLSPERIYCNSQTGELTFIYVPTRTFVDVENDIRGAIRYVCRTAKPYRFEFNEVLSRIEDHILRSTMFTAVDYRRLLRSLNIDSATASQDSSLPEEVTNSTILFKEDRTLSFGFDFVQEQVRMKAVAEEAACSEADLPQSPSDGSGERGIVVSYLGGNICWSLESDGVYTIGRSPESSILLSDADGVSRRHATIIINGDSVVIRDDGSTNGVKINGSFIPPMTDVLLKSGDILLIGRAALSVSRS